MADLEDRLRSYGRAADHHVAPVDLGELRAHGSPVAAPIDPARLPSRRNWWRVATLVAASVIALVAIAAVNRNDSNVVTDDPDLTEPDSELTEVPAPDSITIQETSVGTITWRRVVGTDTELPEIITGTDESGALFGRDRDSSITWRSTDSGLTWDRLVSDGVRTTIAGVEWISRDDLTDAQPPVLSYDDGSGERKMPLPELDIDVPAPFVVEGELLGRNDGVPFSVGGRTIFAVIYNVGPDWAVVTGADDWSSIEIRSDRSNWGTSRGDQEGPAFTYELQATDEGVELVDRAGDIALSVDAVVDGLDGFEPSQLLVGGQATTRLFEFVDGRVRPITTPWPTGQRTLVNEVDGGLLAHRFDPPDEPLVVWHSVDGVSWTEVDLPFDTLNGGGDGYINVGIDDELVLVEQPNGARAWTTTDGLRYTEIPLPPSGLRTTGDFGWATVENFDDPRFQVSLDGADWERVDISGLIDVDAGLQFEFLEFKALGEQIFLTSSRGDRRLLLVGDVTPPTE